MVILPPPIATQKLNDPAKGTPYLFGNDLIKISELCTAVKNEFKKP